MKSFTLLPHSIAAIAISLGALATPAYAGPQKPIASRAVKPKVAKASMPTAKAKQATHTLATTTSRHAAQLATTKQSMETIINNGYGGTGYAGSGGDTPEFNAFLESKGTMSLTKAGDDQRGTAPEYNLTGLASGNLSVTLLLPVSGHVSKSETKRYAATNVYELQLIHADGTTETLPSVKATGLVTQTRLDIKLRPGTSTLQFWPQGSGGVSGYASGRIMKLNWDGKASGN